MRHLILTTLAALLLALGLSGAANAGPFDDAVAAHERGDYATAFRLWRPLADQGNASAQFNLGLMYDNGQGVTQNHAEAVKWYRLAADQGNASAQFNLGLMYAKGDGVPQNHAEAVKWYRLAADQGYAAAQNSLGKLGGEGLDEADRVQRAPIEKAFGGYGFAIRTFWFDVNDISLWRGWSPKSLITDRPKFISSVSGKAVSKDRVGVIGRDGSVKDFDFTLGVDTDVKQSWEFLKSASDRLSAIIDRSENKGAGRRPTIELEYMSITKSIDDRLDENPPTAALGTYESDWEIGIKAGWYIECQVPPDIFSKLENEIAAETVTSIKIGVTWEAGLVSDEHAPPSVPTVWGLFCLDGSPKSLRGHVSTITWSPTNLVKTKPKEARDDMPPPPPAPVAAVAPVVFNVPKSAIAALWVIALATVLYLFK